MTPSSLRRTIVGAALTVLLSTSTLAPATAATEAEISWSGITSGATYLYGQVPAPTCSATDDQLVPPTCVVTGFSNLVGEHTLMATATSSDTVTPTQTTATITYSVKATWTLKGFYKPVKMGAGVWNKAKAGSTVPLKFKVYNGTTKLKGTGVVAAVTARLVSCTDASVLGEPKAVASGRKGSQLKYKTGAFHQNWKTPKAPKVAKVAKHTKKPVAPTACYQVTMTTVDGQALTALFRLK